MGYKTNEKWVKKPNLRCFRDIVQKVRIYSVHKTTYLQLFRQIYSAVKPQRYRIVAMKALSKTPIALFVYLVSNMIVILLFFFFILTIPQSNAELIFTI